MHQSAHYIILNPFYPSLGLGHMPEVAKVLQEGHLTRMPHAFYRPCPAAGLSVPAVVYGLSHDEPLHPLQTLTPAIMRQVRELAFALRQTGGALQIFGMVDLHSPYGSRRMIEPFVRLVQEVGLPTRLHIGVWHPTPKELDVGLHELKTLERDNTVLASVFPLEPIVDRNTTFTQRYIDGIIKPSMTTGLEGVGLPMHQPQWCSNTGVSEDDIFVVTNHSLHGLDGLSQALRSALGKQLVPLTSIHAPSPHISKALADRKHIMAVTNSPYGLEAYFGSDLHDPYFESLYNDSGTELLEMLLSPHFGYHAPPYRTVVVLDEERHKDFDPLLASYLKKLKLEEQSYYCYVVDPRNLQGSLVASSAVPFASHHVHRHTYA